MPSGTNSNGVRCCPSIRINSRVGNRDQYQDGIIMKHKRMTSTDITAFHISCVFLAGLCCFCMLSGCAATRTAEPALTVEQHELNVDSFDYVWKTIQDRHWDAELGGLDWVAIRDELRPQVAEAQTMSQARAVLRDMIGRLEQSHFGIVPGEVYQALDEEEENKEHSQLGYGVIGIEVRVIDGEALVTRVHPDLPAWNQGVRPGWQILRVADQELKPRIAQVEAEFRESTLRDFMLARTVSSHLRGKVGEPLSVDFLADNDKRLSIELKRVAPPGKRVRLGHLPAFHVWFESRLLDDQVGYIAFNAFFDPPNIMRQFQEAVRSFMDTDGIIIDLRGNPGGIGGMAMGMAGWFVEEGGRKLGTMQTRNTKLNFAVFPRAETYQGPLAILIDGCSGSTAEIFSAGMRDLGRARLFGSCSIGAALPSVFEKLPNGDGFQYAIADYLSAGGDRLEGAGVVPDVEALLTREALLDGRDPVIEAAVQWIRSQSD